MRITLDLDGKLIRELMRESRCRTKKQALELAAREFLRTSRRRRILDHFGKVEDFSQGLRERERRRL